MSRRSSGEGSVFRKRDDLWGAHLTLPNGTRKYFYAKTRKDVVEKLRTARIKMERGQNVDDDKRTVGEYLRWWLEDQRQHLAYETWRGYESKARIHLIPAFDNIRLTRLSPIQVREFVAEKMSSKMSSRHVNNIFDVLHAALEDARRLEIVDRNVASLVDTPKITSGKRTALTATQALRLLGVLNGDPLEPLFRLGLTLGLRPGESLGLQWSSVDLDAGTIHICTTLQRQDRKWVIKATPKTDASEQTLPLPAACVESLRRRKTEQLADRAEMGAAWEEWGLVFTRAHGSPIWYSDANRHLARKCLEAKVPKVTMHELRHSAPSILLALGVDQRVIMRVLRHSTIVLTANLYTHVVDPLVTDAVNRIDRAFGGAQKDERFSEGAPEGALTGDSEQLTEPPTAVQRPEQDV
jgi:integrase